MAPRREIGNERQVADDGQPTSASPLRVRWEWSVARVFFTAIQNCVMKTPMKPLDPKRVDFGGIARVLAEEELNAFWKAWDEWRTMP
jgi:hypothetical protein